MTEIITDEFIRYKSGFIDGNNAVIEVIKLGSSKEILKEDNEQNFYSFGFHDGKEFSMGKIDKEGQLDLMDLLASKEALEASFLKRTIIYNQTHSEKKIAVKKFIYK